MKALIDGDVVAFRCAASCEPSKTKGQKRGEWYAENTEPLEEAIKRVDELMKRILNDTGVEEYECFLSSSDNFRKIIDSDYKAHRKDKKDPTWLQQCREHLLVNWKSVLAVGYEADDAIGIAHSDGTIVCSNDKDFQQLPGLHYNFVKSEFFKVTDLDAGRFIYKLLLIGDTADNIVGVAGIGKAKAEGICNQFHDTKELHERVKYLYGDDDRFYRNFTLCRILRSEAEYDTIINIFNENSVSQGKGETATEASSTETLSPFSTVNS